MRRLKLILSVGNVITTNQTTQTVDFSHGEFSENIKYAQGYGIEVYPLPGSKALTIFNAGDRSQGITVLTIDRRYTHELGPGDVMLYDNRNQFIHFKDSGIDIEVIGDLNINTTGDINMNATKINLN